MLTWSTTQTLSFVPHANCGVTQCLPILHQAITFLAVDAIEFLAPPIKHFFTAVYFVTQTLMSKLVIMSATSDLNTGIPETTSFMSTKHWTQSLSLARTCSKYSTNFGQHRTFHVFHQWYAQYGTPSRF